MAKRQVDLGWMRVLLECGNKGSLSGAAQALGLTQPAVSYQIRRLEEQVGVSLLTRQHRGVTLTSDGQRLYELVTRQVTEMDALIEKCRRPVETDKTVLRLHTDYAFSSLWLIPRIDAFRKRHRDIHIQIVATQKPALDEGTEDDVLVAFGSRQDAGENAVLLLSETVTPVCAPAYLPVSSTIRDIGAARLIHLDGLPGADWFEWSDYFAGNGFKRPTESAMGDISFNTYTMVIDAALNRQGVALGWGGLVDDLLAKGTLVRIGGALEEKTRGYWLCAGKNPTAPAARLMEWLVGEGAGRE